MTEAIDQITLHARQHLFSMVARGVDADSICADMGQLGWPCVVVLDTVHAMLSGAMLGPNLTPTQRALFVLAGSAVEDERSPWGYRLRGRWATPCEVVRAANMVLKNFSMPLIAYPGLDGGAS